MEGLKAAIQLDLVGRLSPGGLGTRLVYAVEGSCGLEGVPLAGRGGVAEFK